MEIFEAIRTRRSIREFTGEKIPDEDLEKILDAARYAPSPENMQMWRYVIVRDDQELKDFIAEVSKNAASEVFG
ncbi:MAG: nitroreductase family protein, partial [Theionarchaea archaeon]|nr:nitroreductase family protein [Theionarchaea archaeon]